MFKVNMSLRGLGQILVPNSKHAIIYFLFGEI